MAASLLQLTQARQPCQKLDLPVSLQGDRLVFATSWQP